MTAQDQYDQVKLTLQRLNEDWSPTGETLSHQAAIHLRRDWTEGSRMSAILDMMKGQALLFKCYRLMVQPETYNSVAAAMFNRWNEIYSAASMQLLQLEDTLSRDERARYDIRKRDYYNSLFS